MAKLIGELSAGVLKKLDAGELAMNDLFDFIASGGIRYRSRGLSGEDFKAFKRRSWQRRVAMNANQLAAKEKQSFYNLMYRLHEQGLVEKEKRGTKTVLSITQKGKEKYCALKKYLSKKDPTERPAMIPSDYPKIKSSSSVIISFDIPEKENYKRAWLRSVLRNLNYTILHESVWMGKNTLPRELLDDCRRMKLTKYIHIFSVLKKGTIPE
jgi:DNA-binding PadR family transcriptional regulator